MNQQEKLDRIAEGVSESIQRLLDTAEGVNGGQPPEGEWWDRARELAACPAPDNSAAAVQMIPQNWWSRMANALDRRLHHSSYAGALVGSVLGLALVAPLVFV